MQQAATCKCLFNNFIVFTANDGHRQQREKTIEAEKHM